MNLNVKDYVIEMAVTHMEHHPEGNHDGDGGLVTFLTVIVSNFSLWILSFISIDWANKFVVIIFSIVSTLFLIYRFRVQMIKDRRAGIFVFSSKHPLVKHAQTVKTVGQLAEVLYEAERTDNVEYAEMGIEHYYNTVILPKKQNGQHE